MLSFLVPQNHPTVGELSVVMWVAYLAQLARCQHPGAIANSYHPFNYSILARYGAEAVRCENLILVMSQGVTKSINV